MVSEFTKTEISAQVDAWQDAKNVLTTQHKAILDLWQNNSFTDVVFTGCGSTHYLSLTAASLFQAATGVLARGVPASEILFHHDHLFAKENHTLLVTISRSATTTETVEAAKLFKTTYGNPIVALSCYDDKPLNKLADLNLAVKSGQEESVAQTRSFSSMLILAEGFAQIVGGQAIDTDTFLADSNTLVMEAKKLAEPFSDADHFNQYFYLGSGALYGIAAEAMLKMKEMSLTHAEAYHPMEFRHGPMSMVDEKTVVVGLLSETAYDNEKAVLEHMKALGATTLEISYSADADYSLKNWSEHPSIVRYLPFLQWMAFSRAINKGLDPDNPRNLSQVIELNNFSSH